LLAATMTASCGGTIDPPADAGPEASTPGNPRDATVMYFRGQYIVPPRSVAATYAVPEVRWVIFGEQVVLAYNLPRLLVGQSFGLALAGTLSADRTSATLSGAAGTASCQTRPSDGALVRCDERFMGLVVDLAGVRDRAEREDPGAVEARVAVSQRFASDPIGVLEIDAPIPTPPGATGCATDADCPSGIPCHLDGAPFGVCEAFDP
jgi:hypothetical protein